MNINEEDYLAHYGILRKSGRYPWGSGGTQNTRNKSFLEYVDTLRSQGLNDTEIAKGVGITRTQLQAARTIARNQQKMAQIGQAEKLREKQYSNVAAAAKMGIPESSYRALLASGTKEKAEALLSVANMLKEEVDKNKYIDVGSAVENYIQVSPQRLTAAIAILEEQGYKVHSVKNPQVGTGLNTQYKVLVPPGVTQKEAWMNRHQIKQLTQVSNDGGRTYNPKFPLVSVSSKRVEVNFKEDGGGKADGVIYVRPGVEDLSLGNNRYAQVRIKINNTHYLKGMAIYKNDLPEGTDLVFNTSKSRTANKLDAMKPLESDPDFPFGSVTKPFIINEGTPQAHVKSAMNAVHTEGQWDKWNRNISSQALSKQAPSLIRSQLDMTYEARKADYDVINSLTNPTVKKRLLEDFANSADSSAIHLKAAALERQNWQVIMPIPGMKPTEIYAPNFHDGERVALIRYPHGGTFEIPELSVNNRQREAKRLLGDAKDAVGIHHSVAERLSGADFDGDTVLVIPNNTGKIKTSPALERLKNFNPREEYKAYEGMPKLSEDRKQRLMGEVSNLVTDMTLKGAPHSEIVNAVRHSMVVIDAAKHDLNYKQSAIDHGIRNLKEKYQEGPNAGAATLISRARARIDVPERTPRPQSKGGPYDRETGKRVFEPTGAKRTVTKVRKDGTVITKQVDKTIQSRKLAETNDAHTLVSSSPGTVRERIYADHSNRLKALANNARVNMLHTKDISYSKSARKVYAKEYDSLASKLSIARKNAPLERQAQLIASASVAQIRAANPNLSKDQLKKVRYAEQEAARLRMGAKKQQIKISDEEWNAIQAGAISPSMLSKILNNADLEVVRKHATPKPEHLMDKGKTAKAIQMLQAGYTRAEVARQLGVSITTLDVATMGDGKEGDD